MNKKVTEASASVCLLLIRALLQLRSCSIMTQLLDSDGERESMWPDHWGLPVCTDSLPHLNQGRDVNLTQIIFCTCRFHIHADLHWILNFFFSPHFTKVAKLLLWGREVVEQQYPWKQTLMKYDDSVMCQQSCVKESQEKGFSLEK